MTMGFSHRFLLLGLAVVLMAGCRTYGNEYGREDALLRQIQQTHEQFSQSLTRAQADLRELERLGEAGTMLSPAVAAFEAVLADHEAIAHRHDELVEEAAENDGDYRFLHNTYGALVAEHRLIEDRYERIYAHLAHEMAMAQMDSAQAAAMAHTDMMKPGSWHQVAPPYFERIRYENERVEASKALRQTRQSPSPMAPDADDAEDAVN